MPMGALSFGATIQNSKLKSTSAECVMNRHALFLSTPLTNEHAQTEHIRSLSAMHEIPRMHVLHVHVPLYIRYKLLIIAN